MAARRGGTVACLFLAVAATTGCTERPSAPPPPSPLRVPGFEVQTQAPLDGLRATSLATGDFNGDLSVDIAVGGSNVESGEDSLGVFFGPDFTTHRKIAWPAGLRSITTADLDGDGFDDAVVADEKGVSVLYGDGVDAFARRVHYPLRQRPVAVVATDLDGDGRTDIAAAAEGGLVAVCFREQGRRYSAWSYFPQRHGPAGIAAADFNADGHRDFAVPVSQDGKVMVFLGKGARQIDQRPGLAFGGRRAAGIVAGDFNADGKIDLAVPVLERGSLHLLRGNGKGGFTLGSKLGIGPRPVAIVAGDFNADGRDDIAALTQDPDNLVLLYGTGQGALASPRPLRLPAQASAVATADINLDGLVDFVLASGDARSSLLVALASPAKQVDAMVFAQGPIGGGRSVGALTAQYDDAVGLFKRARYLDALRVLDKLRSRLQEFFLAQDGSARADSAALPSDWRVYVAATLLSIDIVRYHTGETRRALEMEAALATEAETRGDLGSAAAAWLAVADLAVVDLRNPGDAVRALTNTERLVQLGAPQLFGDLAAHAIDVLHIGFDGYKPRLPEIALPAATKPGRQHAITATALPHLDAYGEPGAGADLFRAFAAAHPNSFRGELGAFLAVQLSIAEADSAAAAREAAERFAALHQKSLLSVLLAGDALAAARATGSAADRTAAETALNKIARSAGIRIRVFEPIPDR